MCVDDTDDPPFVHYRNPVCNHKNLVQVLADEKHSHPVVALFQQRLAHELCGTHIQATGRVFCNQEPRVLLDLAGQQQLLHVPTRKDLDRRISQWYSDVELLNEFVSIRACSTVVDECSPAHGLLLAREIEENQRLLIAEHPTRGLDVGATEFVRKTLLEQRDNGVSVLLISEDLDEILMVADRVAVMYEWRIVGIVDAHHVDIAQIGLMMAGAVGARA